MNIQYLHASRFGNGAAGSRYAILTTEIAPQPDKTTGRMPTEDEIAKVQRVRPIMNELLQHGGLVNVAEGKVYVTGIKGPLEGGWQDKVEAFAAEFAHALAAPGPDRVAGAAAPAAPGGVQP